jgi:hypothetical protein
MTDEPSAREVAETWALAFFGEHPSTETVNVIELLIRRERARGMREAGQMAKTSRGYPTVLSDEIDARALELEQQP